MRSIVFASGKGGVGRTSTALNLGIVLANAGNRTIVIDADVAMANVGILLGVDRTPISLHDVLMGEADVRDAMYDFNNLKYVPSSLSLEKVRKLDFDKLKSVVNELKDFDFVLIDCPPGIGSDTEAAITAAKELILVLTPEPGALANALKIKNFAERKGVKVIGFFLNMVSRDKSEITKKDLETVLGVKQLGESSVDIEVRRSSALQVPVVVRAPNSAFARAMHALAGALTGEQVAHEVKVKKSFLRSILDWILGRK